MIIWYIYFILLIWWVTWRDLQQWLHMTAPWMRQQKGSPKEKPNVQVAKQHGLQGLFSALQALTSVVLEHRESVSCFHTMDIGVQTRMSNYSLKMNSSWKWMCNDQVTLSLQHAFQDAQWWCEGCLVCMAPEQGRPGHAASIPAGHMSQP